ncbi:mechanosensitive ion channel family protein [Prochlorothrix hollandica]|uniref:mechanosensitive ion channel family protein n=1 Tax=Prochlorothrix hollandica TaxID=1223 RepID=UPI003342D6E5
MVLPSAFHSLLAQAGDVSPDAVSPETVSPDAVSPDVVAESGATLGLFAPPVLRVLGFTSLTGLIAYIIIFVLLRAWLRKIHSDAGLVAVRVTRIPAIILIIGLVIKATLGQMGESSTIGLLQHVDTALIAIAVTYGISQLLTEVLLYYLEGYAEKSEAQWDDVLIPILKTVLPIFVYGIGGLVSVQSLGIDLSGLWVAIGGITFVLGFALKDILANFFSGVVLLIDTPFRFGDVVVLEDGTRAVIKKVGLRVTNLYVIDQHSELYLPNGVFQNQEIINLTRPGTDYYYTVTVPVKFDAEPAQVVQIIESVALAHPDTLGDIDKKLSLLDTYYGVSGSGPQEQKKREMGRQRLLAERELNVQLAKIENAFDVLSNDIAQRESGGLDSIEVGQIKAEYMEICRMLGLSVVQERQRQGLGKRERLDEVQVQSDTKSLITLIREWYQAWLKDPDLAREDGKVLPKEWEQKIELLKSKTTKVYRQVSNPDADDTRLDDSVQVLFQWLQESFKTTRNQWQKPRVWMSGTRLDNQSSGTNRTFTVKFYVDDITLEHFQRGFRVESEINRELLWQLRQAYLAR